MNVYCNKDEIHQKALDRGYVQTMGTDGDSVRVYLKNGINLYLFMDSENFELSSFVDKSIIKVTTNKCGSFMNDAHFQNIEEQIERVLCQVNN